MSPSPDGHGNQTRPPEKSTVFLLLGTIADTTWRMFVPTIGLTIIGVYIDNTISSKPWMTVLGIIIGTVIAGELIRRQLKANTTT